MSAPSPFQIERAMSAAMRLRDNHGAVLDNDYRLLLDMIEGETDVLEILDRIIEQSITDDVLAEMAEDRAKRKRARKDQLRHTALAMLEALEITKPLERALYTASITRRAKVMITDADRLPPELVRTAPDMHAIARALKDGHVEGAMMSNPQPHLTVRTR